MVKIELYTDGSSIKKGESFEGASAYSIYINKEKIFEAGYYHSTGTNSLGEVFAAHAGLFKMQEIVNKYFDINDCEIIMYSDSEYIVKSLTNWIKTWAKNGSDTWIGSSGKEVAHQSFFKDIWNTFLCKESIFKKHLKIYHINSHIPLKSIPKYRFAFMNKNQIDVTMEEFIIHTQRNDGVDKLAEDVRNNKTKYRENDNTNILEDSAWESIRKPKEKLKTRNGKILIGSSKQE